MIKFNNLCQDVPYLRFKEEYDKALSAGQNIIEAISVASYCKSTAIVDSRYVNLKIIDNKDFIFFSNYDSPKSSQFDSHNQVSVTTFWNSTNVQIRMKAEIFRTSKKFNQNYFSSRSEKKNALAICSRQSKKIDSYEDVKKKYKEVVSNKDLNKCPDYWGGFSFKPYYFEFWQGHENRLNKREVFFYDKSGWEVYYLEP